MAEEGTNSGGGTVLAKLLNQLNLPTLATILLMGGGNLFQGVQSSHDNHQEIERAIREVHQLYEKIDDTERRQDKALELLEQIRKAQKTQ
jgi:hypothetical protein